MHQYLDSDGSGTSGTCVSSTIGAERLAAATAWLKANNLKGFLGEIGAGSNTACIDAVKGALCSMQQSGVWIGSFPPLPLKYFSYVYPVYRCCLVGSRTLVGRCEYRNTSSILNDVDQWLCSTSHRSSPPMAQQFLRFSPRLLNHSCKSNTCCMFCCTQLHPFLESSQICML